MNRQQKRKFVITTMAVVIASVYALTQLGIQLGWLVP